MRAAAAFVVVSSFLATSSLASAQAVKPLVPVASSDTLTLPDARDAIALQPLRLSLMSGAVPHPFGTPGCEPAGGATGMSPLPNQNVAANGLRLFGSSSGLFRSSGVSGLLAQVRLTLFGFSRDGCAFDQLGGVGAALSIPVTKDVMFMWSGGAIYLPHGGPNGQPVKETSQRLDLVWRGANGRAYMVGIGAKNGTPHVSFGGIF